MCWIFITRYLREFQQMSSRSRNFSLWEQRLFKSRRNHCVMPGIQISSLLSAFIDNCPSQNLEGDGINLNGHEFWSDSVVLIHGDELRIPFQCAPFFRFRFLWLSSPTISFQMLDFGDGNWSTDLRKVTLPSDCLSLLNCLYFP